MGSGGLLKGYQHSRHTVPAFVLDVLCLRAFREVRMAERRPEQMTPRSGRLITVW